MIVTRYHCRRCQVDWTAVPDGVRCWSCGLPGARGAIPRAGTFPATVYVPPARQETA